MEINNDLQALLLDTNARIIALESTFIGYVSANESVPVACEVFITYFKFHIELLHELSQKLPSAPGQARVKEILQDRINDSHLSMDYYQSRQHSAESSGDLSSDQFVHP